MIDRVKQAAESIMRRRLISLSRCAKACFMVEEAGKLEPTLEGRRLLADLRSFAKADQHSFLRDLQGRIDPIGMARIEGRREVVQRLVRLLNLDPSQVSSLVENVND